MLKNNISILVVDDEIDICQMVAEILNDENYNAIIATNYDSAIDKLKNENITILITDIWMNNNTNAGLELLEYSQNYDPLKQNQDHKEPFINYDDSLMYIAYRFWEKFLKSSGKIWHSFRKTFTPVRKFHGNTVSRSANWNQVN